LSIAKQRRNQGKEEEYSDLLIKGDGADEGDVDMTVRRKKGDQRQQAAQDEGDPALNVEDQNPTHARHRWCARRSLEGHFCA
jgi:hypothetical protein